MMTLTRRDTLPYVGKLWDAYVDYCRAVSKRAMAINIETAALLWHECDRVNAASVCDLGSGFTSYVLARYTAKADHRVTVMSVDDDIEWMQRSAGFLRRHRLPVEPVMSYDDWSASSVTFDVIIHDFNSGEIRNRTMWEAADRANPGGVIIFDDMQHDGHRSEMKRVAVSHGWPMVDVYDVSTDESHRYAGMVAT